MEIIEKLEYGLYIYNNAKYVGYRVYTNEKTIEVYVSDSESLDYDVLLQKEDMNVDFTGASLIDFEMKESVEFNSDEDNDFTEICFYTDKGAFYLTTRSSQNHSVLIAWEEFEYFKDKSSLTSTLI